MDVRINLYADGTALLYSSTSVVELMLTLRIGMATVGEWLHANCLILNIDKTKFVIFGSDNKIWNLPPCNLTLYRSEIGQVQVMKYLGVYIHNMISFDQHIELLSDKASQGANCVLWEISEESKPPIWMS